MVKGHIDPALQEHRRPPHDAMRIYHNPRCSKSRTTLQILQDKGIEPEVIEYLKNPPDVAELKSVLKKLGLQANEIVRKGEAAYKELFAGNAPSEDELIQAMAKNPILIERPIVIDGKKAVLGRPPENVLSLL